MKLLIATVAIAGIILPAFASAPETSPTPKPRPQHLSVSTDQVDYSKTWQFNYDQYQHTDFQQYQTLYRKYWGGSYELSRMKDETNEYNNLNCDQVLVNNPNMWQGNLNTTKERALTRCGAILLKNTRLEFAHFGRGEWNKKFFDDFLPVWLDTDAFIMKNMRAQHGYQEQVIFDNLRYGIFYNYYVLGPWWGTDTKTDKRMLEWYEKQEASHTHSIWAHTATKCWKPTQRIDGSEFYPTNKPGHGTGLCQNAAAAYTWSLLLTGLYHKSSDHINEALWVVDVLLTSVDENGAGPDSIRGGQAPSYLMKVSDMLDRTAYEMQRQFGYDLYARANKDGTTVQQVIDYGVSTWLDPSINFHYAKQEQQHYKLKNIQGQQECGKNFDLETCNSQISAKLSQVIGKYDTDYFQKYLRIVSTTEAWHGLRRPILHEINVN